MEDELILKEADEEMTNEAVEHESAESAEVSDTASSEEASPFDKMSERDIENIMRNVLDMLNIMESHWIATKDEFHITDPIIKQLHKYNLEHRTQIPDNISEEDKKKWDDYNGLDNITKEEVIEIFGNDSPIIGIDHQITVGRVKEVLEDFIQYMSAVKEYSMINDAYMEYIEAKEEENMAQLKAVMEAEEDPEKKANMKNSLDMYYTNKYLKFLAEPLPENEVTKLVSVFKDQEKIKYYLERSKDKLKHMKISPKIILEVSQFEKRFLPEKYHKLSNMLLLYLMSTVTFCNMNNPKDQRRSRAVFMTIGLDNVVRQRVWSEEKRNQVLEYIMKFEDQFIDKIN